MPKGIGGLLSGEGVGVGKPLAVAPRVGGGQQLPPSDPSHGTGWQWEGARESSPGKPSSRRSIGTNFWKGQRAGVVATEGGSDAATHLTNETKSGSTDCSNSTVRTASLKPEPAVTGPTAPL